MHHHISERIAIFTSPTPSAKHYQKPKLTKQHLDQLNRRLDLPKPGKKKGRITNRIRHMMKAWSKRNKVIDSSVYLSDPSPPRPRPLPAMDKYTPSNMVGHLLSEIDIPKTPVAAARGSATVS